MTMFRCSKGTRSYESYFFQINGFIKNILQKARYMYILRHFEVPRSDQTSHEVASAISRNLAHNLRNFIVALVQLMASTSTFCYTYFVLRWFRGVRYEKFEQIYIYIAFEYIKMIKSLSCNIKVTYISHKYCILNMNMLLL